MMKALKALVEAKHNKQVGKHAVRYLDDVETTCYYTGRGRKVGTWGNVIDKGEVKHVNSFTRAFSYHGNKICLVDDVQRRIILTHAGYNTRSTSRAINDYRRYFVEECGYTEVDA